MTKAEIFLIVLAFSALGTVIYRDYEREQKLLLAPHWEKKCVAFNPLVGGRVQNGFIPVCDHFDSTWVTPK